MSGFRNENRARSRKDVVDREPPARNGGLGVGHLSPPEDHGVVRSIDPMDGDGLGDGIDVPDHERPGFKIIGAFGGQFPFGRVGVAP